MPLFVGRRTKRIGHNSERSRSQVKTNGTTKFLANKNIGLKKKVKLNLEINMGSARNAYDLEWKSSLFPVQPTAGVIHYTPAPCLD